MDATSARVGWGHALRSQNDDDVVRCDGCHQTGTLSPVPRRGLRASRLAESPSQRAAWPAVACVFRRDCRGMMRREWLN